MADRVLGKRDIKIVARGRDLAAFSMGLRLGQVIRGRVVEVLGAGRIIINLRGHQMMAETRGVLVGRGQTLELLVRDLSRKIKLKWLDSQDGHPKSCFLTSGLTISKLLGMLNQSYDIVLSALEDYKPCQLLLKSWTRIRDNARKGPIFLARAGESYQDNVVSGEIVIQSGAYPSVLRIFKLLGEEDQPQSLADFLWFDWCMEMDEFGPISLHVYRNESQLHCDCYVLDENLEFVDTYKDELTAAVEKLGYHPVEISLLGFNENIPQIVEVMDQLSEENVNCRI